MIIVLHVFINIFHEHFVLFNLEVKDLKEFNIPKITMNFMGNLNSLKAFSVFSSLKITTNLLKLKVKNN